MTATPAWRVVIATSAGNVLTGLNASMLVIALPEVVSSVGATASWASWILLSYMLVNTVLIVVLGKVGDLIGRRRLYLGGLVLLTAASLFCGLVSAPEWIMLGRVLQGAGAAAVITNTSTLLTDLLPAGQLGSALGFNVSSAAASQAAGPLLAGLLLRVADWRAVFLVSVPVGALAFVASLRWIPEPHEAPHGVVGRRFDVVGAMAISAGLGCTIFYLERIARSGWVDGDQVGIACVAVLAFGLLVWRGSRNLEPLIDLTLFRDRNRAIAYATVLGMASVRFGVLVLVALFVQGTSGDGGALRAGAVVLPLAAGVMLGSPWSGLLHRRWQARGLTCAGCLMAAFGTVSLVLATWVTDPGAEVLTQVLGMLVVGLGIGVFMPANTADILLRAPRGTVGVANGLRSMLQNAGQAVGTALGLSVLVPAHAQSDHFGGMLDDYRFGLWVFIGIALICAALSAARRPRGPGRG